MSGALRAAAPALLAAVLLAVGVGAGRWAAIRPFAAQIEDRELAVTLGGLLATLNAGDAARLAQRRHEVASAYLDPTRAESELDEYVWDVPGVPVPFVGTAPAEGRHGNATINAQQLRHAGEVAVPKPRGRVRVVVTGGSTTFGSGAPSDAETIPALLEAELSRGGLEVEVVNAAAPAWASSHERAWLESRLWRLQPDLVVSLSGNNDVHWGALGRNVDWMRTYAEESRFGLLQGLRRVAGAAPLADPIQVAERRVPPARVVARLVRNLRLMQSVLGHTPLLFALQPTLAASEKRLSPREQRVLDEAERLEPGSTAYFALCYARLRRELPMVQALEFADLTSAFDESGSDLEIFIDRYHFGDRGNRVLAARLAPEVAALLDVRIRSDGANGRR